MLNSTLHCFHTVRADKPQMAIRRVRFVCGITKATYTHARTHTHTNTYTHTQTHTYTHTDRHTRTHTQTDTHVHTQTHTQTHARQTHTQTDTQKKHTHTHTDTRTDTHRQTHTQTYTHIDTHVHTQTHTGTHTHTHTEYEVLSAFPQQHWLRERATTYIASLVVTETECVYCSVGTECLLGAFANLRIAIISFVMSVRQSVWNNSAATGRIFMKFDIRVVFRKSVEKIQVSLKCIYRNWRAKEVSEKIKDGKNKKMNIGRK